MSSLSILLNKDIKEDSQQVQVLCKNCHKLVLEFGEIQNRAAAIKNEIFNNRVHKTEVEDETDVQETKEVVHFKVVTDGNKDNEISKKMLFIASSDEDSTTVST